MTTMEPRILPNSPLDLTAVESATVLEAGDISALAEEHRIFARHSVESCRPIAVRCLDDDGEPLGRWFLSDILDLSEGGLCLLASEAPGLEIGQRILLDLRAHPSFGQTRMRVRLRWFVRAHFAVTFGVAFDSPLALVPSLEAERRSVPRDPNLEEWAFSEEG
jgi:hypothetical protein